MLIRESSSPSRQDGEAIAEDSEFASVSSSELDRRRRADGGAGAHEIEESASAGPHAEEGRLASLKVSTAYTEGSSEYDDDVASCDSTVHT